MKFLDALLGRSKPKQPKLDALFGVTGAAITLEAAAGMRPTGQAAVCFKPASGQGFAAASEELHGLLELAVKEAGSTLAVTDDRYGYRWVVLTDPEMEDLVTSVHLVNSTLEQYGFGPQLLCSVFAFSRERGAAVPPRLPLQAGQLLPVRAAGRRAPGQRAGAAGQGHPGAATCRSSRSWPAGSPSGDCRSADSLAVPAGAAARRP